MLDLLCAKCSRRRRRHRRDEPDKARVRAVAEFGVVRRPFGRGAWHAAGHSNEATLHMQHVQTTLRAVRLCLAVIVTITVAVCVCICICVCV